MTLEIQENETPFNVRCDILSEIWLNYRDDQNFEDFIAYNDLGLPLAYCISSGIIKPKKKAMNFVNEAWLLLLAGLEIEEDTGFEDLDDVFQNSNV